MLTLAQWKDVRRVDHADLGLTHPRIQAQAPGVPALDGFDADVTACAAATNDFDRVGALGRIVARARTGYLDVPAAAMPQRYAAAAVQIYDAARADLSAICLPAYQVARTKDIVDLANAAALAPKAVQINVFYLAPVGAAPAVAAVDAVVNNHIGAANNAAGYQRAGISFVRTNAHAVVATQTAAGDSLLLPAIAAVPAAMRGKFADGGVGGPRLVIYSNASGGAAGTIDVVYLDHYDQVDVQGRTFRAGADYAGQTPTRPIITVTLNPQAPVAPTYQTTLAHEMGHALTGYSDHSVDPNSLMAAGAIRNGTNAMTDGMIGWFRNNPNS